VCERTSTTSDRKYTSLKVLQEIVGVCVGMALVVKYECAFYVMVLLAWPTHTGPVEEVRD
jgi:hypothetical protein